MTTMQLFAQYVQQRYMALLQKVQAQERGTGGLTMVDRDRLIELLKDQNCQSPMICDEKCKYAHSKSCYEERIADHLLANGVIVPPCKVGDTVYYVDDFTEETEECKVYGFAVVNSKFQLLVDNGVEKFVATKWYNTKEEAEAKLKEMKEDG